MGLAVEQGLLAYLSQVAVVVPLVESAFSSGLRGLLGLLGQLEGDPSAYPQVVFHA